MNVKTKYSHLLHAMKESRHIKTGFILMPRLIKDPRINFCLIVDAPNCWIFPFFFLIIKSFDLLLQMTLKSFEFDRTTLLKILWRLWQEQHKSPFYSIVLEAEQILNSHDSSDMHNNKIEMHRCIDPALDIWPIYTYESFKQQIQP
jgi:hypothetical protein